MVKGPGRPKKKQAPYIFKNVSGNNITVGNNSGVDRTFKWDEDIGGETLYNITEAERQEIYRKRPVGKEKKMMTLIDMGQLVELDEGGDIISGVADDGKEVIGWSEDRISDTAHLDYDEFVVSIKEIDNVYLLEKMKKLFVKEEGLSSKSLIAILDRIDDLKEQERRSRSIIESVE